MSYARSKSDHAALKARREGAARAASAAHRSTVRRRRNVVVVMGGLVAVVGLVLGFRAAYPSTPEPAGPANMLSDGVLLQGDGATIATVRTPANGDGVRPTASAADPDALDVSLYLDYADAGAATFWSANGDALAALLAAGQIRLELHPLALAGGAGAAQLVACAAESEPEEIWDVHRTLVAAQPELAAASTEDLVRITADSGLTDQAVEDCLNAGTFQDWVAQATARAETPDGDAVTTSPVVVLGETVYDGALDDADAFLTALTGAVDAG